MTPGAELQWNWEMYGLSARLSVKEIEESKRIVFQWIDDKATTVELRFIPWKDEATYVQVTETGLSGDGDELASYAANSTGGYYQVLCALKALLEHNVVLTVVLDHTPPKGLEL